MEDDKRRGGATATSPTAIVIHFARCIISTAVLDTILTKDPATTHGGALDLRRSKAAESQS